MKSKQSRQYLMAAIVIGAVSAAPITLLAAEQGATKPSAGAHQPTTKKSGATGTPAEQKQLNEMSREARRLMANVSIARLALAADMPDVARKHVYEALPVAEKLVTSTSRFNVADPALAARLTFNAKAGKRDFWLPIENSEFVVRTIDEALLKRHRPEIVAADARMVHVRINLDTANVLREVRAARDALVAGNFGVAMRALDSAQASAVSETEVVGLPVERVRDNLILARELARDKDFGSASFALGYAREALAEAEKADPTLNKSAEVSMLSREIAQMQAQIKAREPSVLQRMERSLDGWVKKVEKWPKHRRR